MMKGIQARQDKTHASRSDDDDDEPRRVQCSMCSRRRRIFFTNVIIPSPLFRLSNLRFTRLVLLHRIRGRTVHIRTARFAATGRTTISTRPASVIRCPTAAKVAASHAGCDIVTHSHEWWAGVITIAASRVAALVASIIRRTSTDTAAGHWDGSGNWELCSLNRLRAEAVAGTIRISDCRYTLTIA